MSDDDEELVVYIADALPATVHAFMATDTATGAPALGLRLDAVAGREWPWGGTEPLLVGLTRKQMGEFLGELTDAAERVYTAAHGEDDDGSRL